MPELLPGNGDSSIDPVKTAHGVNVKDRTGIVQVAGGEDAERIALGRTLRGAGLAVLACARGREVLAVPRPDRESCLLIHVQLPDMSALDLQRALAERGDGRPVIFFAEIIDAATAILAMKAGALDFLAHPCSDEQLIEAVRRALALDRDNRERASQIADINSRYATLTPRERQVLEQVVAGLPSKAIAVELGAAEKTIKIHRGRVMTKMKASSIAELVRLAAIIGVLGAG